MLLASIRMLLSQTGLLYSIDRDLASIGRAATIQHRQGCGLHILNGSIIAIWLYCLAATLEYALHTCCLSNLLQMHLCCIACLVQMHLCCIVCLVQMHLCCIVCLVQMHLCCIVCLVQMHLCYIVFLVCTA